MHGTILPSDLISSDILFLIISFQQLRLSTPNTAPIPLYPSVSPLNACVFDGNPFMDLMDFSGLFSRIWEMCSKKKKKEEKLACPGSACKSMVDCRGQHFCLHQKNEKFSAYKTGRTSQYGSESWLTSIPCEKKAGHNEVVKLLPAHSEVKLGDRLESRKKGGK